MKGRRADLSEFVRHLMRPVSEPGAGKDGRTK